MNGGMLPASFPGPRMGSSQRSAHHYVERVVPGDGLDQVYLQHLARYRFASEFVANREVLDVACGSGYAAPLLCAAGASRYWGIDISPEAIAIARGKRRSCDKVTFRCDDACRLATVADQTIDVAISFETIEHLTDPQLFLWNVRRVLRTEGLLIVSTPNRYLVNPRNDLDDKPANPFHIREWNRGEFLGLLDEFFEVRQVLGQQVYPAWKARILHQAGTSEWVRLLLQGYGAMRRIAARLAPPRPSAGSRDLAEVEPVGSRQESVFLVCVAAPRRMTGLFPLLPESAATVA